MKQNCSLHSARDTNMDGIYDNSMEKMEIDDSCITPADKTNQHLPDREGPSSSCSKTRRSFRPKLQATKSFPPYSQCIGGLGEDGEANNDPTSELVSTCSSAVPEDKHGKSAETETKTDQRVKCSREAVRAKWRSRRKEMSWRSCDVDTDVPERGLWCGKRMEGVGKERKDEENEGDVGKHRRDKSSKDRDEEEEKKTGRSSTSTVNMELMDTRNSKDEDPDGTTESSTKRHLILSRLLHSSSTSSSCSSINFSSAESDEVFSEGEDAASKSQNFRKVRSRNVLMHFMFLDFYPVLLSHRLGLSGFPWKRHKTSTVLNCSLHLLICMSLKENFDKVSFEWHLHGWLLLQPICEQVEQTVREPLGSSC